MGNWADVLDAWKAYGAQNELTPSIIAQTGRALRGLERFDQAAAIIKAGLKDTPDNADLVLENARIADDRAAAADASSDAKMNTDRLNAWKAAVQVATADPGAWQGLILTLLDGGNSDGARAAVTHARSSLPDITHLLKNRRLRALVEGAS